MSVFLEPVVTKWGLVSLSRRGPRTPSIRSILYFLTVFATVLKWHIKKCYNSIHEIFTDVVELESIFLIIEVTSNKIFKPEILKK